MKITLYLLRFTGTPQPVDFYFDERSAQCTFTENGITYPGDVQPLEVRVPEGSVRVPRPDGSKILSWEQDGILTESNAQQVYTLARLGLCGFRLTDNCKNAD
jgi:hypothetical protein